MAGHLVHEGFHAHSGLFFRRDENGMVHITDCPPGATSLQCRSIVLDPNTWASAVASVSARGETSETFHEALRFHQAEATPQPSTES